MPSLTQKHVDKVEHADQLRVRRVNSLSALFSAMRPRQWLKNAVVCAPMLFATKAHMLGSIELALGAMISFCMLSSAVYIFNDITDRDRDQLHSLKRFRPIASGALSITYASVLAVTCVLSGLAVEFFIRPSLCVIGAAYVTLTLLYSRWLKHRPILDVFSIAAGFVLRLVAGAVAIQVVPSPWLLLCTTFGALFLALEKRRHELYATGGKASVHRATLSFYSESVLDKLQCVVTPCMVLCYALYTFMSQHGQWMMLSLPFVLYAVFRYQALVHISNFTGTPEEVFWKDRPMQLTIILWTIISVLVVYQVPGNVVKVIELVASYKMQ